MRRDSGASTADSEQFVRAAGDYRADLLHESADARVASLVRMREHPDAELAGRLRRGQPPQVRIAIADGRRKPERITALIVRNGNAYEEGLSADWDPLKAHWRNPTPESRDTLRSWLTRDGIRLQCAVGLTAERAARLSPETYTLDAQTTTSSAV